MDKHTATEQAYKRGYDKGYADGLAFAQNELKPIKEDVKKILQMCKQLAIVTNVGDKSSPTINADRCVCCGAIIPEGQMVCPNCLVTVKEG